MRSFQREQESTNRIGKRGPRIVRERPKTIRGLKEGFERESTPLLRGKGSDPGGQLHGGHVGLTLMNRSARHGRKSEGSVPDKGSAGFFFFYVFRLLFFGNGRLTSLKTCARWGRYIRCRSTSSLGIPRFLSPIV